MRVERRQLEIFLAIAEAGSFTQAASRLRVAQPSLSYAIRMLEKELATPLFERLGRGVRLTPAGEALVAPARRTMQSFSLAKGAVRGQSAAGFGRVTVVSSTLWAVEPLVPIVGEFRRLQPSVQFVVLDPAERSDVLTRVLSGDVDVGLASTADVAWSSAATPMPTRGSTSSSARDSRRRASDKCTGASWPARPMF